MVLIDLADEVADELALPFESISVERGIYHFTQAVYRGVTANLVAYLTAQENRDLGVVKTPRLSTRIVFSHLQIGQKLLLRKKGILWGHQVYIGALRLQDNSLLTVIAPSYCHTIIDDYAQHWGIETLFTYSKFVL
ncbi:MAG: hypothetical protein ACFCU5_08210 [Pleurocapsa sp.]